MILYDDEDDDKKVNAMLPKQKQKQNNADNTSRIYVQNEADGIRLEIFTIEKWHTI